MSPEILASRHEKEKDQISRLANARLPSSDLALWDLFGHTQRHVCFLNRKMVIYKSNGVSTNKILREPEVLAVAAVTGIRADIYNGIFVTFVDTFGKNGTWEAGPVPSKPFGLDAFLWVSHHCDLKFAVKEISGSRFTSEATFAMASKIRSAHRWNNKGNVYISDLKDFKEHFCDFDYEDL